MKKLLLILICLFVSFEVKSKEVRCDELLKRDFLFYEKFSDIPYTGKLNGVSKKNHPLCRRGETTKGQIIEGKREGKIVTFDEEGNLSDVVYFKNNKRHGKYLMYDKYGHLIHKSFYEHGLQVDYQVWICSNGKIQEKSYYKNNRKNGEYIEYRWCPIFTEKITGYYKNSEKDGKWIYFTIDREGNEKIYRSEFYKDGKIIEKKEEKIK